jgi:hypothetical protein
MEVGDHTLELPKREVFVGSAAQASLDCRDNFAVRDGARFANELDIAARRLQRFRVISLAAVEDLFASDITWVEQQTLTEHKSPKRRLSRLLVSARRLDKPDEN